MASYTVVFLVYISKSSTLISSIDVMINTTATISGAIHKRESLEKQSFHSTEPLTQQNDAHHKTHEYKHQSAQLYF